MEWHAFSINIIFRKTPCMDTPKCSSGPHVLYLPLRRSGVRKFLASLSSYRRLDEVIASLLGDLSEKTNRATNFIGDMAVFGTGNMAATITPKKL